MKKCLSFDDVLLTPNFSTIKSRADVNLSQQLFGVQFETPFISSNMDTVTTSKMAQAMRANGGLGALHRFCSIEENVKMFLESPGRTIVSIGLGGAELDRAEALHAQGGVNYLIDIAHGACSEAVKQYEDLRYIVGNYSNIIVGNFATAKNIEDFKNEVYIPRKPDAYKVGIGGGSACLTRVVTGCGIPTLASILDCASTKEVLIADGGIRNSGDAVKALAAGASLIMCGKMFAGTDESPGERFWKDRNGEFYPKEVIFPKKTVNGELVLMEEGSFINNLPVYKKYRGSASLESYEVQGKVAAHRAPEGDSYLVPYVGSVKKVLEELNAGIRSACSYVGANSLMELKKYAEFVEITNNGARESQAHGKL